MGLLLTVQVNRARLAFERIDRRRVVAFRAREAEAFARLDRMMFGAWNVYTALRRRVAL